jgi:hypothetical protein
MNTSINQQLNELLKYKNKFRKCIVWGLRHSNDSFRYIHRGYFNVFDSLGFDVLWLDDSLENQQFVGPNDFVFTSNRAERNLPIIKDTYYCFHNSSLSFVDQVPKSHKIILQVYTDGCMSHSKKIDSVTYYDPRLHTLYQPWGTDLMPWEFRTPVFSSWSPFVFWAGSIWNNPENQGNTSEIHSLKEALANNKLLFKHISMAPDWLNLHFIRWSRIAPTIAGHWQAQHNYLPCRMWKNISYGQLGITNVSKFCEILDNNVVYSDNILDLVDKSLSLSKSKYMHLIKKQQQYIKHHTYLQRALMVLKTL